MGFGTAVTGSLFILTLIAVSAMLFTSLIDVSVSSAAVLDEKARQTQSRIHILSAQMTTSNNTGTNITTINVAVENTGEKIHDVDTVDLYINEQRISRNNRSVSLNSTTDVTNPGLWDPGEILEVEREEETDTLQDIIRIKIATSSGATTTVVEETP